MANIITKKTGKSSDRKELQEACNQFYTRIPHYFGMKVPPMIRYYLLAYNIYFSPFIIIDTIHMLYS